MEIKVLGSSSRGNCYILATPTGSLLIEAGLRWKEIQKGLDFDLSKVVGCLVTHEHKDHSKAVIDVMKAGITVHASVGTLEKLEVCGHRAYSIIAANLFNIGNFSVMPFDVEHDCEEPLGYLIQYKPTGEKLLFITDSYYCKYRFNGLNYIMIECNYCKDILNSNIEAGALDMKNRLLKSHFSLEHVKDFLKANDLSQCGEIILLHLSDGNSDAARMVKEIEDITGIKPKIADTGLEVKLELYPYYVTKDGL